MEKVFKFSEPTQVKFLDFDSELEHWIGGIGYQDVIICGCCGAEISLDDFWADWHDLKDMYPEVENPLVVYPEWVDFEWYLRE